MILATTNRNKFFSEKHSTNLKCKNVLIIDSNQITSDRIKKAVLSLNYNCIGITVDFLSADKVINKRKPNYIIINSDLKGEFSGTQTAKIISLDYEIPILMFGNSEDPLFLESIKEVNPRASLFLDESDQILKEKLVQLIV